ncbi:MAG: hypothetical protein ABWZ15_08110, partial [Acidimicrobiia bacterium]
MATVREKDVDTLARQIVAAAAPDAGARLRSTFDVNAQMLRWATARPHFKTGLFRFVDVFPACTSADDVLNHLDEYVLTDDTPGIVRAGLRTAHVVPFGSRLARAGARFGIRRMAEQFIGGADPAAATAEAGALWAAGFATTVDLLGEKTLTIADADAYAARVRAMLAALVSGAATWPAQPLLDRDPWGSLPRVN